jgi:hypothetical protein
MEKRYWQIAVGSDGRDYAEDFIRYGLAFIGGPKHIALMQEMRPGDIVVARRGVTEIIAAGYVVERDGKHIGDGDKEWLRDYDGWDLKAYCHVNWHKPDKPIITQGLTRNTIHRIHKPHLMQLADQIICAFPEITDFGTEPDDKETLDITDNEILNFLIHEGLRPAAAEELTTTFNRIRLLAKYYYDADRWSDVREHETRTFLVIPLLLALGWTEQQIKIELPISGVGRADIGCFSKPFMKDDSVCKLIIETKGFSQGLTFAPSQAMGYAAQTPDCTCIVVTNGYCYKAYVRQNDGAFITEPSAYLNLLNPKARYPLNPQIVAGGLEVLQLLMPSFYQQ